MNRLVSAEGGSHQFMESAHWRGRRDSDSGQDLESQLCHRRSRRVLYPGGDTRDRPISEFRHGQKEDDSARPLVSPRTVFPWRPTSDRALPGWRRGARWLRNLETFILYAATHRRNLRPEYTPGPPLSPETALGATARRPKRKPATKGRLLLFCSLRPESNHRRKAIQPFSSILITSNGLSLKFSGDDREPESTVVAVVVSERIVEHFSLGAIKAIMTLDGPVIVALAALAGSLVGAFNRSSCAAAPRDPSSTDENPLAQVGISLPRWTEQETNDRNIQEFT
jgi:hypothetical protein